MLYAGNVGFSQSLDLVVDAARAAARRDVPDQRRRRPACPRSSSAPRGVANVRFAGYEPEERARRAARHRRHPRRAAARRARRGQRAVEDLLDPRRRPPGRRRDRPRHRGAPPARRVRRRRRRRRPTTPTRFTAPLVPLLVDAARRAAMGAAGRAWVERQRLAGGGRPRPTRRCSAGCRAGRPPAPDRGGRPVASHPRGSVQLRQESRQARPTGKGKRSASRAAPCSPHRRRRRHRDARPRRLRPGQPRRPTARPAAARRPLARRLRLLPLRRHRRGVPAQAHRATWRRRPSTPPATGVRQPRLRPHRRAQPRRRRHPLAPVHQPARPATAPSSACSSTSTTSSSTDTSRCEFPAEPGRPEVRHRDASATARTPSSASWCGTASPTPSDDRDYVTDFDNIRIDRNGMVFTIAFVPKGKDIAHAAVGAEAARARRRRRRHGDHRAGRRPGSSTAPWPRRTDPAAGDRRASDRRAGTPTRRPTARRRPPPRPRG